MGQLKVTDNAATTLAASLTNSPAITSMTLTDASKFPVVNNGGSGSDWSYATLFDASNNLEIVKVTRRDTWSNVVTIIRGSAAGISGVTDANCRAWSSGSTGVACRLIAQTVNDIAASANSAAASAASAAASVAPLASVAGLIKGTGGGAYSAAVPGTDYTNFAAGTRLVFAQASAPVGWTQDVSDNADNRMLRVVKTAGAGVGGSHSPILNDVVPSHTHVVTVGNQSADHSHGFSTGGMSADHIHYIGSHSHSGTLPAGSPGGPSWGLSQIYYQYDIGFGTAGSGDLGTSGSTANHTHSGNTGGASASHTHSATTDNGSSSTNWTPRYVDLIICQKD